MKRSLLLLAALLIVIAAVILALPAFRVHVPQGPMHAPKVQLPEDPNAVKFAVIGDNGTGEKPEYDVAEQMARAHTQFPFDVVVMLGDNMYGGKTPADYRLKFEDPYKTLLDEGVKFYASLGNHDDPNEAFYKPYNMGGKRYYIVHDHDVEFFALDSTYMSPEQIAWLTEQLSQPGADWKICFFHHPLYSAARFHGPDVDLRLRLEPLFEKYGVNLVLSGHEHVYERVKPQHGIYYFVLGNSGQLRYHDLRRSRETAKGFDTDRSFMLMEATPDKLYFQTFSRTGDTVDSGVLAHQSPVPANNGAGPQR